MKCLNKFILALTMTAVSGQVMAADACQHKNEFTNYVNPWIGTGGHGHVFLGANVPFGVVQLGPTEHTHGWDWCSGYHISDSVLVGFGHTHLSGTGIGDLGDIGFLPVAHCSATETKFSHANESVRPGYYAIRLQQPNVFVELTATKRVGFHRYTFGADNHKGMLRIDLRQGTGWDNWRKSGFSVESPTMVTGFRQSSGWARNQHVFFAAEFSTPVKVKKQVGDSIMVLTFEDISKPVMVKCAISAVSVEDAKANLKAELPGWDFKATVAAANQAWNDELGKIDVDTDDDEMRRNHLPLDLFKEMALYYMDDYDIDDLQELSGKNKEVFRFVLMNIAHHDLSFEDINELYNDINKE